MNKTQWSIALVCSVWIGSVHADEYWYATQKSSNEISGKFTYFDVNQDLSSEYLHCRLGSDCLTRSAKQLPDQVMPAQIAIDNSSIFQIYFGFNEYKLTDEAIDILAAHIDSIRGFKSIQLRGWTDPVGGKNSNQNLILAKKRAEAVAAFLKNQGIQVPLNILYQPPCCNSEGSSKSPDSIRRNMRIVEVVGVN